MVNLPGLLPALEAAYKDIHAHPELSMQEHRTAGIAAKHLQDNHYDVTGNVGKTGVVGVLRNGDGPTVMPRADMDALPIREETGLDYASIATAEDVDGNRVPVAHACGHDMRSFSQRRPRRTMAAPAERPRSLIRESSCRLIFWWDRICNRAHCCN